MPLAVCHAYVRISLGPISNVLPELTSDGASIITDLGPDLGASEDRPRLDRR